MNTTAPVYQIRGRLLNQSDLAEIRQVTADHGIRAERRSSGSSANTGNGGNQTAN